MTELKPGSRVTFQGGTGRYDEDEIVEGIVNGDLIVHRKQEYVPVHVPASNHNVIVNRVNILSIEGEEV